MLRVGLSGVRVWDTRCHSWLRYCNTTRAVAGSISDEVVEILGRSQWPSGLKARVCGRPLAGFVGSNPAGGMNVCVVEFSGIKTFLFWILLKNVASL